MKFLSYTRTPLDDAIYGERLAYGMHLAYREKGGEKFTALHHNEAILFAKAESKNDDTLEAKCLRSPFVFKKADFGYGIIAFRTQGDGSKDTSSEGCVLLFESHDLVHFNEVGLLRLSESGYIKKASCRYDEEAREYIISYVTESGASYKAVTSDLRNVTKTEKAENDLEGDMGYEIEGLLPEGCVPCNIIDIDECDAKYIIKKLGTGKIGKEEFDFPILSERADPFCMLYKDRFYFIATNDADGNNTLYMRCFDDLHDITSAKEALILSTERSETLKGLLWAPEMHVIGGELYLFFAATESDFFGEEARVMKLKSGGDPMNADDWSEPELVIKKDGSPLCEAGKVISLDMTVFENESKYYAMWSQRRFVPTDSGAWLYAAEIDKNEPWKLQSDPVVIAKPEFSRENNHTFVVEGPFAIKRSGTLMITYSAAMVDTTYNVGLLKFIGSDVLDPSHWQKSNYSLLSSASVEGQFGPGHNCYVKDKDGTVWNFYHAKPGINELRCVGIRKVYFDIDGEPILDVTG